MEKKKRGSCGTILLVIIGIVVVAMIFRGISGKKNHRAEEVAEKIPAVTQAPNEDLSEPEEPEIFEESDLDDSEGSAEEAIPEPEPAGDQPSEGDPADIPVIGVTPEFKEAMDSYEAFFDEYVEFMKKYSNSDDQFSMMNDYLAYLERYSEVMEKLDAIDEDQLSDADMAYYIEVNARIEKKLLEVSVA